MAIKKIIAGIDDSQESLAALRYAAEEAKLRGAELEVVTVFPPAEGAAWPAIQPIAHESELEKARRDAAQRILDQAVESLGDAVEGVKVDTVPVKHGRASAALIDRSKDADLLIVAHRGRGGFRGLRLGSTSEQVARHAHCPVVVVRPNE